MATGAKQYVIWGYKLRGCQDCGAKPIEAGGDMSITTFHCHHRNPADKHREDRNGRYRSMDASRSISYAELLTELAKCDVVCETCHYKRHRNGHAEAQIALFNGSGAAWKYAE